MNNLLPCLSCVYDCKIRDELEAIWHGRVVPASDDAEFRNLVHTFVSTLSDMVKDGNISTPEQLGEALAALFDLCVSLEYAKLAADIHWVYCPPSNKCEPAVLFYPYVRACPRCARLGRKVLLKQSHKPGSGTIGHIAAKTLSAMLAALVEKTNRQWQIYQMKRQILDVDTLLVSSESIALCEVKASPLVAFPLAILLPQELQRRGQNDRLENISEHVITTLPLDREISLYIPNDNPILLKLGKRKERGFPIRKFTKSYAQDKDTLWSVIQFWRRLYHAYRHKWAQSDDDSLRWLTFGCGGQVDDSKNLPGIDRTDDIKKGVYQVLKLGEHFAKRCAKKAVKIVLCGNIHAARHHQDYLSGLEDITWTYEQHLMDAGDPDWKKVRAADLVRLYDAVFTFTQPHFRDRSLSDGFGLEALLDRLGET
ncbi:MAG: hypothetical protein KatS3mg022_0603 [Armatimonadota bacterium]|nr:MAG: hypothetical protein KatS3mg022_0603 [Armatimonadota bacterium]